VSILTVFARFPFISRLAINATPDDARALVSIVDRHGLRGTLELLARLCFNRAHEYQSSPGLPMQQQGRLLEQNGRRLLGIIPTIMQIRL
jgi:hypothetical protein